MNNSDIIISICQHLDDIEKFIFLSAAKWLDLMKGKLLFNDPVHLYWIYFHRYFHQFTNIIVCKKVEEIVLPNGIVIRNKKPRFPKAMRKIELQKRVNYLYRDLFPEGITHIKINRNEDIQTYYSRRRGKSIFPETLTHLVLGGKNYKIDVELPISLQFIDAEFIAIEPYNFSQSSNLQHITSQSLFPFPSITSIKCMTDELNNIPITLQKLSLNCFAMALMSRKFDFSYFVNIGYLNLEKHGVSSCDTIQFPPNITHLKIEGLWRFDKFPITLIYLELCNFTNADEYECYDLPHLTHFVTTDLYGIPEHNCPRLYYLECKYFRVSIRVPITITHLKINNYLGTTIWDVPQHIIHLTLYTDSTPTWRYNCRRPKLTHIVYSNKITNLDISSEVLEPISLSSNLTDIVLSPKCYALNKKLLLESNVTVCINRNYEDSFVSHWDSQYTGHYNPWYDD